MKESDIVQSDGCDYICTAVYGKRWPR